VAASPNKGVLTMSGDTDWVELERAEDQGHERAAGKIWVNLTSGLTMTYDVREDRSTIWAPGDSQAIATVKGEPGKILRTQRVRVP
jgi:hypothetical protein